jgi:hypothetical protein
MSKSEFIKDTLMIRDNNVPIEVGFVNQSKMRFFIDNPRVYSVLRSNTDPPDQQDIEEALLNMDHVKNLIQDIKLNGGLIDPVIIRPIQGKEKTFEVLEGNSRLAAYRALVKDDGVKWSLMKCSILPEGIEESLIFALLGQYHIKGKKDWVPYEQAGFLFRRFKNHHVDLETLAKEIGLKINEVKQLIATYQFMVTHNDNQRDRWSHYDEYLKSHKIKKAREQFDNFDNFIVDQIKRKKIPKAVDIRDKLKVVCSASPKVLRKFINGRYDLEDAYEIACDSGGDNHAFKRLNKYRQWIGKSETESVLLKSEGPVRDKIKFELDRIYRRTNTLRKKMGDQQG